MKRVSHVLAIICITLFLPAGCGDEECTDDCISESRQCFGNGYRTCGQHDSDDCLDWSPVTYCASGEICLEGECENIEEISTAAISLSITDFCDDGYAINYKFFDVDHDLVWPSASSHYYTEFYDYKYTSDLSCIPGAKICYGAATGELYWGVGINGDYGCEGCCVFCEDGKSYGWDLTC